MQTAYEVLSDPVRRARYDIEQRRQRRREWRAAIEAALMADARLAGLAPSVN